MSLDSSLKQGGGMQRHRNVLTRVERIARLKEQGKFDKIGDALGLPKVGNRKLVIAKKKKKGAPEAGA